MAHHFTYFFIYVSLNTLMLCLMHRPAHHIPPTPQSKSTRRFYYQSLIAHQFIPACLLSGLVIVCSTYITLTPVSLLISSALMAGTWMFTLANCTNYSRYKFNITWDVLKLGFAKGADEIMHATWDEYAVIYFAAFANLCMALLLYITISHLPSIPIIYLLFTTCFYLLLTNYIANQLIYTCLCSQNKMRYLQYTCKFLGYHALSWYHALSLIYHSPNDKTYLTHLWRTASQTGPLNYPAQPLTSTQDAQQNILIIAIDACRFDMINAVNMPHLYAFAQQSQYFTNHWSLGNTTQPGIFGLFYGLPANYWDATKQHHISPLLIDTLQQQNYRLQISASANLINPPLDQNVFYNIPHLQRFTKGDTPLQRDQKITQDMKDFISQQHDKPFFGFLFYDAPHTQYLFDDAPSQFTPTDIMNHITIKNTQDRTPLFNQYKNTLYAVDQMINDIITQVKEQDLLERTTIIITADHGQEYNDFSTNDWEHPTNFAQFQTKIPLIVHTPGKAAATHTHKTAACDITATLMRDILHIQNPLSDYCIGKPLFTADDTPFIIAANYTNYAVIDDTYITVIHRDGYHHSFNHQMKFLEDATPDYNHLKEAAIMMQQYYAKSALLAEQETQPTSS